jgi:hypothetical protein
VIVAGDLLWYPVEGHPEICQAPDVMVVFGRPKGHRGSYMQWLEENIPPQVVFEIVSPSNRAGEWIDKARFYEQYGSEEFYIYHPELGVWDGFQRKDKRLVSIPNMEGWTSPHLSIRFERGSGTDMGLFYPDGGKFLSLLELDAQRKAALQQAEAALQQAEAERQRAERLAKRLREMGVEDVDT